MPFLGIDPTEAQRLGGRVASASTEVQQACTELKELFVLDARVASQIQALSGEIERSCTDLQRLVSALTAVHQQGR